MNIRELQWRLQQENISTHDYSLEGGLRDDTLCLNKNGEKWEVYYSERGHKNILSTFVSEEEACEYLYNQLTKTTLLKR